MTPSAIRTELLAQHGRIRTLIDDVRRIAERLDGADAANSQLHAAIAVLADALRRHNQREEELLGRIIPSVDAWGPVRAEIMDEEHVAEHREMHAALMMEVRPTELPPLLDRMIEHMAHEEETLLRDDLLRDDLVVMDYFGG